MGEYTPLSFKGNIKVLLETEIVFYVFAVIS